MSTQSKFPKFTDLPAAATRKTANKMRLSPGRNFTKVAGLSLSVAGTSVDKMVVKLLHSVSQDQVAVAGVTVKRDDKSDWVEGENFTKNFNRAEGMGPVYWADDWFTCVYESTGAWGKDLYSWNGGPISIEVEHIE